MHYTPDIRLAPDDEIVCWCSCVTKGTLLQAVQAGAHTLDDVRAATGACTKGQCKEKSPRGR